MKRNIISIKEDLCNGCGLCVSACAEGALKMINGKAKLISDSYCDGLGACLPECPTGAIEIIEREAEEFDEELVQVAQQKHAHTNHANGGHMQGGCPSMKEKVLKKTNNEANNAANNVELNTELTTWPIQIKLVNPAASFLQNADLLIAADCTAFAYADFHRKFMKNKVTLIGCPKLDETDYSEKISEIISRNNINSITVLRMEVPCCAGIVDAVKHAIEKSKKFVAFSQAIVTIDGDLRAF